ncbi:MAG: MmgE/PrpD family protein, partial [Rhodoferax sp.]|nr:MmgE/PrpD family protein [Rhodoferax sp.]
AARAWGQPYGITGNAFKPHAACMITHPTIDAALSLRAQLHAAEVDLAAVATITCRVNPLVPRVAGHLRPTTGLEGKFSLAYGVVAGLVDGHATPDAFTDAAVARPEVVQLLSCVVVGTDPAMGEQQAEVTLRLRDGRIWRAHVPMALGNPANPMSDTALGGKFLALAGDRLRDAPAALDGLWRFDRQPDAGAWLGSALQPS